MKIYKWSLVLICTFVGGLMGLAAGFLSWKVLAWISSRKISERVRIAFYASTGLIAVIVSLFLRDLLSAFSYSLF